MNDDDQHNQADSADEEITDGKSIFGSAPEVTAELDTNLKEVGLPNDDEGPRELNSQEVIDRADKNQE